MEQIAQARVIMSDGPAVLTLRHLCTPFLTLP